MARHVGEVPPRRVFRIESQVLADEGSAGGSHEEGRQVPPGQLAAVRGILIQALLLEEPD